MNMIQPPGLSIAAVERDTGLAKDTLRVWERRYGFPLPERDAQGERSYPQDQVDKLRLIRRLIDQGLRPAKLVGLDNAALAQTLEELGGRENPAGGSGLFNELLESARLHCHEDLRRGLQQSLMKLGLQRFVMDVIAPLNVVVGDSWLRGELGVPEEHLYTEQVQNLLRTAISAQSSAAHERPRVLLTTFPGEQHALGLLMVEASLAPEGASCVSLGVQTPADDIRGAAAAGHFDIVALSFSTAYPVRRAVDDLRALQAALPPSITLWAGGAALAGCARKLPGVNVFTRLADVPAAIAEWRVSHAANS
jgi:DNA-binding transcriptional MerR regulator/methylmalonyl-CoA mutase cobalamin-binding subunit